MLKKKFTTTEMFFHDFAHRKLRIHLLLGEEALHVKIFEIFKCGKPFRWIANVSGKCVLAKRRCKYAINNNVLESLIELE